MNGVRVLKQTSRLTTLSFDISRAFASPRMLSNFRLPWCTEQMGSKLSPEKMLYASPTVDMQRFVGTQLKRSRPEETVADARASLAAPPKKPRLELETSAAKAAARPTAQEASVTESKGSVASDSVPAASAPAVAATPKPTSAMPPKPTTAPPQLDCLAGLTPLQQVIDNEFNMAMLLKHNELRLIEQELAKCQVALEQLRRCELRPYPGMESPSPAVTEGTGPAIEPLPGHSRPTHPPPHGVTDGPYARHYRQWLLHDPTSFDTVPLHAAMSPYDSPMSAGGRSTRNHGSVRKSVSSRTHAVTTRHVDSLPGGLGLPATHYAPSPAPPPRDKSAPLVLRRSTDGQLVKLLCNNCLRGNFSSIQGFLNHCRIAHKVDYKSHDLAAIDCGRLLDDADRAKLPPEMTGAAPAAPTPTATRAAAAAVAHHAPPPAITVPSYTAPSPFSAPPSALPTPTRDLKCFVHPLNSPSAALPTPPPSVTRAPVAPVVRVPSGATVTNPVNASEVPLKPSAQVPRLSAFFAKHGCGGDLATAFAAARQPIDLSQHHDGGLLTPDTPDCPSPSPLSHHHAHHNGNSKSNQSASHGSHRPASRKGHRQPTASSMTQAPPSLQHSHSDPSSPAATTSSHHHLPGLVSDHEDDEDRGSSVSADEPPPSPDRPQQQGRQCDDAAMQHAMTLSEHDDVEEAFAAAHHGERVFIRRESK